MLCRLRPAKIRISSIHLPFLRVKGRFLILSGVQKKDNSFFLNIGKRILKDRVILFNDTQKTHAPRKAAASAIHSDKPERQEKKQ